ncbi:NTP transferase domain-containing protein [Winogradskyella eckloniae]|uniref:sugar phosphate nucleotidyltransferase n=1 Tax=Winogradskyella eckloniae TaxID=1089306 RepID=UPI0015639F73|nr:sugar phosphate nucleotidyltransferase [Winogradskyella eckloniae]NRD19639.1 NTP transferase domain-containing protein [Winogradskyella eckloniae]
MHTKIDVVIMAGGKGSRLMPLTEHIPKPLLKIGNKPIIEYNIDLLKSYGIPSINVSVHHFSEQIISYLKASDKIKINFITEDKPLGTIGALKIKDTYKTDNILVLNADVLTNIDLKQFVDEFLANKVEALVATAPYVIALPHDIIETKNGQITTLKPKHQVTYNLNAGIYLFKKSCLEYIPENTFFNATDLINTLLSYGKTIKTFPITQYWIDIGQHHDFKKANEDINDLKFPSQ